MRKEFSNLLIVSMKRIIVFFVIILLHCSCSELNEPEYNNNLDPKSENYFTRKPYNLTITSSTPTSIDLKWSYPTTNYAGFNFEFSEDLGHFSVLQKLDKKFYSIGGLDTSLSYYFRINAFYEDINTEYSDTLYAKYFNIPTYNI